MNIIPNALALIKEYVSNGGGLLMIGGYSFPTGIEAKTNYKTPCWPKFCLSKCWNMMIALEIPEGCCLLIKHGEQHVITPDLTQWPLAQL